MFLSWSEDAVGAQQSSPDGEKSLNRYSKNW